MTNMCQLLPALYYGAGFMILSVCVLIWIVYKVLMTHNIQHIQDNEYLCLTCKRQWKENEKGEKIDL